MDYNPLAEDDDITALAELSAQLPALTSASETAAVTSGMIKSEPPLDGSSSRDAGRKERGEDDGQGADGEAVGAEAGRDDAECGAEADGNANVDDTNEEAEEHAAAEEGEDEEAGDDEDGDEGGYAAEYRSLLYRVAEMETQEEQREWQKHFAMRTARREAKLMARVVRQQQVAVAGRVSAERKTTASGSGQGGTVQLQDSLPTSSTSSPSSAPPLAATAADAAVSEDLRLLLLAHRTEVAQQQRRRLTDGAAHLQQHANALRHSQTRAERLRGAAGEVLAAMYDEAGIDQDSLLRGRVDEVADVPPLPPPPQSFPSSLTAAAAGAAAGPSTETWEKHSTSLTALGGTLAKVHTLFQDAACRSHMSVLASTLAQLGRRSQEALRELRQLAVVEAELEAELAQHRSGSSLEWSLFAAHVQQSREMADLHSPVTVAEMRAMALRKLLQRRRQELQNAVAIALVREAERGVNRRRAPAAHAASSAAPSSCPSFTSPAAAVTVEKVKATADDCARRETLRDRLLREVLFLKKCARREFGEEWVAAVEAAAVAHTAAANAVPASAGPRAGAVAEPVHVGQTLSTNLCLSTYDALANMLHTALEAPGTASTTTTATMGTPEASTMDAEALSSVPPSQSVSFTPRVRVLALLESVQTRVNSLTSLLLENAKHWQRVCDVRVETEVCSSNNSSGANDETWTHAADALLARCGAESQASSGDSGVETCALLRLEQQLLDATQEAANTVLTEMNAALAQLREHCIVPVQKAKRDVLLLLRLLQVADETLEELASAASPAPPGARPHSTAALETVVDALTLSVKVPTAQAGGDASRDAFDALLSVMDESPRLPRFAIPQPPHSVHAMQAAMRAVSQQWEKDVHADCDAVSAGVVAKQASLDQYAQYSMADVPALLGKANAALEACKAELASKTAQRGRAATLAGQLEAQRRQLEEQTTTQRAALQTALHEAQASCASLEAEVAFLRACKSVCEAEAGQREAAWGEEAAAWAALTSPPLAADDDTGTLSTVKAESAADAQEEATDAASPDMGKDEDAQGEGQFTSTSPERRDGDADDDQPEASTCPAPYDEDEEPQPAEAGERASGWGEEEGEAVEEREWETEEAAEEEQELEQEEEEEEEAAQDQEEGGEELDEWQPAGSSSVAEPGSYEDDDAEADVVLENTQQNGGEEDELDEVQQGEEEEEEEAEEAVAAQDQTADEEATKDAEGATEGTNAADGSDEQAEGYEGADVEAEEEEEGRDEAEANRSAEVDEELAASPASATPQTATAEKPVDPPDEEASMKPEEDAWPASVLGSTEGVLPPSSEVPLPSVFGANTLADAMQGNAMQSAPAPPPPLPPVFPQPPVSGSNAVLDDNPFYSGFGFDDN